MSYGKCRPICLNLTVLNRGQSVSSFGSNTTFCQGSIFSLPLRSVWLNTFYHSTYFIATNIDNRNAHNELQF